MISDTVSYGKILTHLGLALGGSILILAGLYYAVGHAGHDIDPRRLLEIIKASSPSMVLLYVLTMVLGLLVRAARYLTLLRASGENNVPGFKDMTLITAVRNMTVDLLPARIGELAFVALLRAKSGTRVSSGLSALLFATMLDILVLAPVTVLIGLVVGFPNKQPYLLAIIALFVAVAFILGVRFILPLFSGLINRWAESENRMISAFFRFIHAIDDAVQSTMRAGVFTTVMLQTVAVRFFKYAGLLCLYYGVTHTTFPSLAELNAFKVLGAAIASEMTASLPIPTLMSFGSWELGGMTLLAYFGAVPQAALLTMLGIHIQSQALDYGIGLAALMALLMLGKSVSTSSARITGVKWLASVAFILLVAAFAWFSYEKARENPMQQNQVDGRLAKLESGPSGAWLKSLDGYIVWSSNRSGIHNIWKMSLPDKKVTQLTNNQHTENFARISPDGKRIVFARSHKKWQSVRDEKPWDIWMLEIATGKEKRLAKWGFAPSWSPDGSFVVFKRDPGKIMAVDVKTLKERVYYASGHDKFLTTPENMATPSVGEGKRMAFTFRYRGQPTNVIRDTKGRLVTVHRDSCQVLWAPSGDFVTYVQKGGKQINQIMRYDPDTKKKTKMLDLPGDFSHEYFARLSGDERYMVFAASDGGHEHDLANYEIFVWPVGADDSEAVRLTHNMKNDSWPDIWLN